MTNELYNAPPRLSDLRGDELREALRTRHEDHRREWMQSRRKLPLVARVIERLCGAGA